MDEVLEVRLAPKEAKQVLDELAVIGAQVGEIKHRENESDLYLKVDGAIRSIAGISERIEAAAQLAKADLSTALERAAKAEAQALELTVALESERARSAELEKTAADFAAARDFSNTTAVV